MTIVRATVVDEVLRYLGGKKQQDVKKETRGGHAESTDVTEVDLSIILFQLRQHCACAVRLHCRATAPVPLQCAQCTAVHCCTMKRAALRHRVLLKHAVQCRSGWLFSSTSKLHDVIGKELTDWTLDPNDRRATRGINDRIRSRQLQLYERANTMYSELRRAGAPFAYLEQAVQPLVQAALRKGNEGIRCQINALRRGMGVHEYKGNPFRIDYHAQSMAQVNDVHNCLVRICIENRTTELPAHLVTSGIVYDVRTHCVRYNERKGCAWWHLARTSHHTAGSSAGNTLQEASVDKDRKRRIYAVEKAGTLPLRRQNSATTGHFPAVTLLGIAGYSHLHPNVQKHPEEQADRGGDNVVRSTIVSRREETHDTLYQTPRQRLLIRAAYSLARSPDCVRAECRTWSRSCAMLHESGAGGAGSASLNPESGVMQQRTLKTPVQQESTDAGASAAYSQASNAIREWRLAQEDVIVCDRYVKAWKQYATHLLEQTGVGEGMDASVELANKKARLDALLVELFPDTDERDVLFTDEVRKTMASNDLCFSAGCNCSSSTMRAMFDPMITTMAPLRCWSDFHSLSRTCTASARHGTACRMKATADNLTRSLLFDRLRGLPIEMTCYRSRRREPHHH
ncbi:hypothetical protein JKP88DRAFT_244535 [Tribonema minus]|uniref:Uncharacterized protein n=1 Tax=Tribonema minus TaxID=303371 RepID=A0A836CH12_9STRA|nr:hypothetical protein JKP88DRAFT_244535 [Tribonema minus]